MAERKVMGQYFILSYESSASPVTWVPVACLTSKTLKVANKTIDATSDCGADFLAGLANSTVSAKGFYDFGNAGVKSGQDLFSLQAAAQNGLSPAYTWKIAPVTPVTGDPTWTFNGAINNFQGDFNVDAPAEFSVDLLVQTGGIVQTIT